MANRDKNRNKNVDEEFNSKININCLACIYDVHHLKPYKMRIFKK